MFKLFVVLLNDVLYLEYMKWSFLIKYDRDEVNSVVNC